mmetsp:Transcript_25160/g.63174  ORF Transcript_25160/g.63174 Transcript_25160/m.63174 type:complete len:473 (-) Transcript_25160:81-1499(-)
MAEGEEEIPPAAASPEDPSAAEAAPEQVGEALEAAAAAVEAESGSGGAEAATSPTPELALAAAGDDRPPDGKPSATFLQFIEHMDIVKAYEDACVIHDRKINVLVRRSLQESIEAGKETFFIEAPGNHKLVFTCRLGDEDMDVFVKVFSVLAGALARLDLSYNQLTDSGAVKLASMMPNSNAQRLTSLSLRSNSIGPDGCFAICQAIVQCPALRRLDFSHNPLGPEGGTIIVDLLSNMPHLLELFVQDTEANIDMLVAIAKALLNPELKLKVCNVENPRIETLQEDHTVHLGRMLRVNTHLSEIYLGKVKMRDEGIRQLVSFLLENKTLRILDLRCNELGADGAKHLGVLLSSDCQLSHLNLSGNRIGEKCNVTGAAAIAQALLNNRMLRHLDLNSNSLCGEALKALADAVDQNSTLETIALFHNQWDQPSSSKFHQILNDRARILPLRADFVTSEVDLRIDICKVDHFEAS